MVLLMKMQRYSKYKAVDVKLINASNKKFLTNFSVTERLDRTKLAKTKLNF